MQQLRPATEPGRSKPRVGWLRTPQTLLRRRRAARQDSGSAFRLRLLLSATLAFALVGVAGYVILEQSLAKRQLADYAATQRADARAFEAVGDRARNPTDAVENVDQMLEGVSQRPGTLETILVDKQLSIKATGLPGPGGAGTDATSAALVGTTNVDPRVRAALEHGTSFVGRVSDPAQDPRDYEFVVPVNMQGGRYAYETTYDHRVYDARLNEVRKILELVGLLALFGGGGVFYLVGGRRLMRDHRMVLRGVHCDGLTDLPNLRAFQEQFPLAVASATRYEEPLALVLLDIDDFRLTNDQDGHLHADTTLKKVAGVLREARPSDRPYRIGGDEFALLLARTDPEGAQVLARRLSRDLADAGIEVSVGVSAARRGLPADTLRAEADSALQEAKRQGGGRAAHFDDIRGRVAVTSSEKKAAVRRLIAEGRFETAFQPIWHLDTGALLGVEALTRPDPSYGLSGPAEAFDIAEQLGRVRQLDVACVENALRFANELEPGVLLFVNLSPISLELDADANAWLEPAVERAGLSPQAVVVEVTERFGGRADSVVRRLQQLSRQGFGIAIDDVGTGNSGLDMLRQVGAGFVKLDRSIVVAAATDSSARGVLMAMATFARQTGAVVIAEGVEDADTLQFLHDLNKRESSSDTIVQAVQGFLLGRPSRGLSPSSPAALHDSSDRIPSGARRARA